MKMAASICHICNKPFRKDEEYIQVETESSKEPNPEVYGPNPPVKRTCLVPVDATPEQICMSHFEFQLGSWMHTFWVCLRCVEELPLAWRKHFAAPSLEDWVPIEKLGENEGAGTETWKAQRKH